MKINKFTNHLLNGLIIIDIVLISRSIFVSMPENILFIILGFDFFVCIFLLIDWANDLFEPLRPVEVGDS